MPRVYVVKVVYHGDVEPKAEYFLTPGKSQTEVRRFHESWVGNFSMRSGGVALKPQRKKPYNAALADRMKLQ